MTKILTILFVLIGTISLGQNTQIDTFRLPRSERFKDILSDQSNFPIIRTADKKVDSIINFDLKNQFTSNEYLNEGLDSTLIKWAGDQIVYLDFEVTYNQSELISIRIHAEGCGAYCTNWTDYFNYKTSSGVPLNINDIIDTSGEFRSRVYGDMREQYAHQKIELLEMFKDPESGVDQATYEWALDHYQDCENSFNLETFSIKPNQLEIIEVCYLPNAIKNLAPIISLSYDMAEIEVFLNIKF